MTTSAANSFPKEEKLCGQIRIKHLYEAGKHFTVYPLRITYLCTTEAEPSVQVVIWAAKSLFRRANRRNRLRRLMREAYRVHSQPLKQWATEHAMALQIAINYISKEEMGLTSVEAATEKAINRLLLQLNNQLSDNEHSAS